MLNAIARLFQRDARDRRARDRARADRVRVRAQRVVFEPLEPRLLLSVDLIGIPDWDDQGQMPAVNGQVQLPGGNPVSGSVNAIAAHPTDANTIFVGAENGGVWRTTNGGAAWAPLTDQFPSTSIGSLAYSPLDATNNTLFAGTGNFTNGFSFSNGAAGLLRTTDGGNSWVQLAGDDLAGMRVISVVPTATNTVTGQLILVATPENGVLRSVDGGANFTQVSGTGGLPNGAARSLIVDPNNAGRFYAAVANQGVYVSSGNNGVNWTQINTGIAGAIGVAGQAAVNIELSAHDTVLGAGGNTVLYVGIVQAGQSLGGVPTPRNQLTGVFRDTAGNDGVDNDAANGIDDAAEFNWVGMGAPPGTIHFGGQAINNFTIQADRTNNNLVYVGGDRQGANPFVGNLFIGNSTGNVWTSIVLGGTAGNTAPHADSRAMAFDVNNNLLEGDDAGIVRLTNPTVAGRDWASLNGNLGITQFYSVSYDSVNDVIFGGTQDSGSTEQQSAGSATWNSVNLGDGNITGVANTATQSVHYTMSNNLIQTGVPSFVRRTFDNTNAQVGAAATVGLAGLAVGDATFGGFTLFPYVINSVNGQRMLLGTPAGVGGAPAQTTGNLYESTNQGDTMVNITPAGQAGVNAMAYGGTLGGAANADVAYVAFGNNLFLRSTPGGAASFNALANYAGGTVTDIVLDPDNWQRAYVLDSNSVFFTPDAGATFVDLTANLDDIASSFLSVTLYSPGTAPGDEVVVVGAQGGVFRTLNAGAGANALWTEFGRGLPNMQVTDITYVDPDPAVDGTNEALIAGTYGRGAWKILDADESLPVAGVLQITGDDDFANQDDNILIVRDAFNPSLLNVVLNGGFEQFQLSTIQQINVFGYGGNDTLTLDSSNGLINVAMGTRYDGDGGSDLLQLFQTGGPTHFTDTYRVGPDLGAGSSVIVGNGTAGTQSVLFENLDPVIDLVAVATLTVHATDEANSISYGPGASLARGRVAIDAHETIEFANKAALVVNAGAGADAVSINHPGTPTGLAGITIHGGDPGAGDSIAINGVGVAVAVNTAASTIAGATGSAGGVGIGYTGIELLGLTGGVTDLTLTTTAAADALAVTPGVTGASNSGSLNSSGAVPSIMFINSGNVTANLAGGNDTVSVTGSALADVVAVGGAAVAISGRNPVDYTGAESVAVAGLGGSDSFNVTPSSIPFFIDGGDPVGTLPGDLLTIFAGAQSVIYNAGPETDEGSFDVGANAPVSFDHIESFAINGSGPAVINATNGPDAITVIARDLTTHAGTNGVQDFTVSVNSGPQLLFVNVGSLTLNALGGSDEVTIVAPAPNNAVWDVSVAVNGGPPAADGDRVIVQTPGAAAEVVSFTPSASDAGVLDLVSLSSPITLAEIETLSYDGQNDGDGLTVVGSASDDSIVHTPGGTNQAGSFAVNGLLALNYQNLGAAATLLADGLGGSSDTLVVHGTAANDNFVVNGNVALNARLPIATASIETLTLESFAGDDTFTLVPAISASVFTTLNFNGGAQASGIGDRVFLVATAGADAIAISGQQVKLGTRTVNGSGIEAIKLDGLGGADEITYTGVVGVTDNVTIASSGVAGGGQIIVPNVALVDFSGVESFVVNGNTSTPTETDTLAFSGTNGVDLVSINMAANGSTEPVLRLGTPASPLLTLRNYTNLPTLRINGLDGADTFNVYTADSLVAPNRQILIDGGAPTAKKKLTDKLNVFYTPSRPRIVHSTETQNPQSGLVDLAYTNRRYLVQYADIEDVTISRGVVP